MQKTVFAAIVCFVYASSAAGQAKTDSLQSKVPHAGFLPDSSLAKPVFLPAPVPANFYSAHLPFFCDKELKLQKAVKMSVKFRIGSVEACDKLEGKY